VRIKAGIQAGDIITKFKGKAVKSTEEINEIKASMKPGDIVDVEVYRDGETKTLKVTLSEDKGTVN
jgi:serine protease Do